MLNLIIIFGAKYLILLPPAIAGIYFLKSPREIRKRLIIFLLIALPLAYLAGLATRYAYFNPRPFVVGGFGPLIAHETDNGFPSDHVLLAATLAASLLFFDRKRAYWLAGIAVFIAFARVYAGVHHLTDVVASIIIALLCATITSKLYARK
ncbi:MAG: phosphatase PAP2 family protein [Patescibacteria group bacterium]